MSFEPSSVRPDEHPCGPRQDAASPAHIGPAAQHVAELIERNDRRIDQELSSTPAHEISRVGIVGAGVMGARIAAICLRHGLAVTLVDQDPQVVAQAPSRVRTMLAQTAGDPAPHAGLTESRLTCACDLSALGLYELVIEAVPEKLIIKHGLLAQLEKHVLPDALIATNTSTIPIGRLATCLVRPDRFCGLHFFLPLGERPALEITPGQHTTRETLSAAVTFCRRLEHMALVVRDGPGFVANRLLMTYLSAALDLLAIGVDMLTIDRAAQRFGMACGPLRLYDEIGLDVAFQCAWSLSGAADSQMFRSPLLVPMVRGGCLGRKTGHGFFSYPTPSDPDTPPAPDPKALELIARWAAAAPPHGEEIAVSGLMLSMVQEAARLLEEGRARDAGQIDLAAMFGLGFPCSRGGLLYWADTLGVGAIVETLRRISELSPRFEPTSAILDLASRKGRFYDTVA